MPETLEEADGNQCRTVHHALISDKDLYQTKEEAERKDTNRAKMAQAKRER